MPEIKDPEVINLTFFCKEAATRLSGRPAFRYCFVLGAGASITSGIPGGEALAVNWLQEAYERDNSVRSLSQDAWAKQAFGGDFDPKRPGEKYGEIYRGVRLISWTSF
jgi:protein O-mannosyl-transferase